MLQLHAIDPRFASTSKVVFCNGNSSDWDWIDIECKTVTETSDSTKKENFQSLCGNSLSKVLKLKGYTYNWKGDEIKKRHAGLLAQQVEKVVPEAVFTVDSTGEKLLAYSHFIPYLVEAIKEQQATIDEQQTAIEKLTARIETLESSSSQDKLAMIGTTNTEETISSEEATLSQNIPNPFSSATRIDVYLPETVSEARLYVYNMQGAQIKSFDLRERGNTSVTIEGYSLDAGMYLYTLIADGKEMDTKKMVLTE